MKKINKTKTFEEAYVLVSENMDIDIVKKLTKSFTLDELNKIAEKLNNGFTPDFSDHSQK